VNADDLVERAFRLEAERERAAPLDASGARRMRDATLSPATRRSASICSATVQHTPGIARLMRDLSCSRVKPAAWMRKPTAARGLAWVWRTVSATGSTASAPASGSRMMPEKNPDAALLGLPGRTQMVGSRMPTPSRKPRR
jgi:hypothetical protein